jgi:glycosyltransferase involved in cell wall biosynthesis/SAM-dependent methyltransferase
MDVTDTGAEHPRAEQAHAVLVAGMHRTGTSALTRVLSLRGIDLPRHMFPGIPQDNERGFWESIPLNEADDQFLRSIGSAWDDVSQIAPSVLASDRADAFADKLVEILSAEYGESPLFVVKDPRLCRLVPVWLAALERFGARPSFVITTRNPLEVAGSLRARNDFSTTKSCLLWLRYLLDAEHDSRGFPRVFVSYERLLDDWVATTDHVARELHLSLPSPDHATTRQVEQFLSPALRHHSIDYSELSTRSDVLEWVKQAFEAVSGAATEEREVDSKVLDEIRVELDSADLAYGPLLTQAQAALAEREEVLDRTTRQLTQANAEREAWGREAASYRAELASLGGEIERMHEALSASAHRWPAHSQVKWWLARGRLRHVPRYFALRRSFDYGGYLAANRDVAAAGLHPLHHYIEHGAREGRPLAPPPRTMDPTASADLLTPADEVRWWVQPGPGFEEFDPQIAANAPPRAKVIAYYLPQFHSFPENDEWWGKGFTEWSNVARGSPRFSGHYQPRVPRDLGFYDLAKPETLARQVDLARAAGIHGFSFYYYWFDGKRLLERPVERFLADPSIDFPFCLMWANENWTRRWDGQDQEILIAQTYDPTEDVGLVDDLQRHFADPRYIRLQGRPLLLLYRADRIPDASNRIEQWRELWRSRHGEEPLIFMAQAFGTVDPRPFGFDGAFEFPPHKLVQGLSLLNSQLTVLDPSFSGNVSAYDDVVAKSLAEPVPEYPLVRTATPSWDNDARRQGAAGQLTLHESTPATYEGWLRSLVNRAAQHPVFGEPLVFVNAWNEWAEAAYLEPDVHYGAAYLNATARALCAAPATGKLKVLLVGHDALQFGAQMTYLHLAETLTTQFGCEIACLLLGGGPLMPKYQQFGRVYVTNGDLARVEEAIAELRRDGFELAVTNTALTGGVVPLLKAEGYRVASLIHELPGIIGEVGAEACLEAILEESDAIVVAAEKVADSLERSASFVGHDRTVVRPQGLYKQLERPADARASLRRRLGLDEDSRIVLNVGFADSRKGIDTFVEVAKAAAAQGRDLHFVWLGNHHFNPGRWLEPDIKDRLHLVTYTDDVAEFYFGADAFFLSSREDPFPSVVLEAMVAGLPVVGIAGASGTEGLIAEHGRVVDRADVSGIVAALDEVIREDHERAREARASVVADQFRWDDYCFDLLRLLDPDLEKVSVVVPNYNYARHLDGRMRSIFDQTYPVFETIVLDDCSTDDSLARLDAIARTTGRRFRVVANNENSGSPFAQWERGARLARGTYVWVAEADDGSDPRFLEEVVSEVRHEGTGFAFTDSISIDEDGSQLGESYKEYYRESVGNLMDESFELDGKRFAEQCLGERNLMLNASAVVWDRAALIAALDECREALGEYRLAGDWHLYAAAALRAPRVAYLSAPLNIHRRHDSSVTASLNTDRHVEEVERVHAYVAEELDLDDAARKRMSAYGDQLRHQFGIAGQDAPAPVAEAPPVSVLEASALGVARDWVESAYYDNAENAMDVFWGEGSPFLELFGRLDLTAVAELACGHGRHAEQIADRAESLVVMDVNEPNIDFCRKRLARFDNVEFVVNNGYDLQPLSNASLTAIYCYDAMVHFPGDVVGSYLRETSRVLRPGGLALYHHSNFDGPDEGSYSRNPHARNRMTRAEFGRLAQAAGLEVGESRILDWGGVPELDCLTLVRKA